jgi:hypothetical protein
MSKKGKNGKPQAGQNPSFPLFFSSPQPLEAKRHGKATVRPTDNYAFASSTNSIPVNAIEFVEICRHYPIVFAQNGDAILPVAVVGLEKSNYFVDKNGKWREESYIPGYVRQYPFVLLNLEEQQKLLLCIDESAPHFSTTSKSGDPELFDKVGKPSPFINRALEFCKTYYQHHRITVEFGAMLKKYKLLVPYKSDAKLASGRKITLGGFQMISEKALSDLSDKDFLELRKKGWLPFIYFAIASSSNWKHLVEIASKRDIIAA